MLCSPVNLEFSVRDLGRVLDRSATSLNAWPCMTSEFVLEGEGLEESEKEPAVRAQEGGAIPRMLLEAHPQPLP